MIIIGLIGNTLNLLNVSAFWKYIAKGLIIIIAIIIDAQTEALLNKRRKNL